MIKLPPPFANTPGLSREEISRYDDRGPAWAWYTLTIGEHVGTHLDAPIHWVTGKDGKDVASVEPTLRTRVHDRLKLAMNPCLLSELGVKLAHQIVVDPTR